MYVQYACVLEDLRPNLILTMLIQQNLGTAIIEISDLWCFHGNGNNHVYPSKN